MTPDATKTIKCTCCGKELPRTHNYFNWQNNGANLFVKLHKMM